MIPRPRWTPARALWLSLAASLVLVSGVVWLVRHRHDSDVLPPDVVRAVDAEKATRPSIDSAVAQARYEADIATADKLAAIARADQMQRAAAVAGHRADSLALEAKHAATARDSAVMWHLAYAARTSERDTLLGTIDTLRLAVSLAEAEARANARGRDIANAARLRADSVLDATVHAAAAANCRVPLTFGLVHCLSRTQALVVGAAAGVGGKMLVDAIRDGRLTIPIPFRRPAVR